MAVFLGKLLNVRAGEWRGLGLLYAMSLVIMIGSNWGETIVQAAFLQRVGVQYLPWVFISSAACSFAALFIYAAFADRLSNTRLLLAILGLSGLGILVGLAGLAAGLVGPAYLLLYLVLNVPLLDVYNVHWATYVNGFYDLQAAKRVVPVLSTAARLAGIASGLSMPLLNRLFSPPGILWIWLGSLGLMAGLALLRPRWVNSDPLPAAAPGRAAQPAPSYSANLREGYRQIVRSPFLGWMALATLSMTVLLALLQFQASAIFQERLQTTVQISSFLGILSGTANLIVLPFQLFLLSRMITRLGLGNASLVYPLLSLGAAGALSAGPGLGPAALAHLDRTALRTAFRIPIENLLYNAVPQRVKARTRAFVGGLIVPLGTILGGLLLLTPLVRQAWFLRAALPGLGLAFAAAAWMARRRYGQALLALLEQEEYALLTRPESFQHAPPLPADPAALEFLAHKLETSPDAQHTLFLAHLLGQAGGQAALPWIVQAIRTAQDGRLRAALLGVPAAAGLRGPELRRLYTRLLSDCDEQVRLAALDGLELLDGPGDSHYRRVAAALLEDVELEVRLHVLPALLAAPGADRAAAAHELRALLACGDPAIQARALQALGQARALEFLPQAAAALEAPDEALRLAGGLALEALAGPHLSAADQERLLVAVLPCLQDPIERLRLAAVTVLERLNPADGPLAGRALAGLRTALGDASPRVGERASTALVHAGRRALQPLRHDLESTDPQRRKLAALTLARLDRRAYVPRRQAACLNDNLAHIYRHLSCLQALAGCPGPAANMLSQALRQHNAVLLEEFFYLLGMIQERAAVLRVADSLRSPQPALRANAAEALEALTAPQTAALVAALCNPDLPQAQLPALAPPAWRPVLPTPSAALHLLLSEAAAPGAATTAGAATTVEAATTAGAADVWLRPLAAAALAELDAERPELAQAEVETPVGKLLLLHQVPFLQTMSVAQLWALAAVCTPAFFPAGSWLFQAGEPGGALYVLVDGRVELEQEKAGGDVARLTALEAPAWLGEADFLDDHPRSHSARAVQDTHSLRLEREPLLALARRQPDLAVQWIQMLGVRLRQANEHLAALARPRPRPLHRLYDQLSQETP